MTEETEKPLMDGRWDERTELLIGTEAAHKLRHSHILIVGPGGVGGYAAELLCRAGVGRLTLVDADVVNPSNINRQIIALHSTVGRSKVEVLADRLLDINPRVKVYPVAAFLKDEAMEELLDAAKYDFVVDAIDSLSPKVFLIALSKRRGLPVISSMGAGAKRDASLIEVADIARSYNCTLARAVRKRLRKLGISRGVPVVFSSELPDESSVMEIEGERCKRSTAGTISYMPAIFGCRIAAYVIEKLTEQ